MRKLLLLATVLLFYGCATRKVPLPPLPPPSVYGAGDLPAMAIVHKGPTGPRLQASHMVIQWENEQSAFATNYQTTVESSGDLKSWERVAVLPFQSQGSLLVTNTAPRAYYRVCNTFK